MNILYFIAGFACGLVVMGVLATVVAWVVSRKPEWWGLTNI